MLLFLYYDHEYIDYIAEMIWSANCKAISHEIRTAIV